MITDKQFDDSFTTAGGWFILTNFETVLKWTGTKADLVDELFKLGFDSKIKGTRGRVSCLIRIIENDRAHEALVKIRDSKTINKQHPGAFTIADGLIKKYY